MPRRRQYKRKPRGPKRGRRGARKIVNVNRALQPFAQRYITKMKYSEAIYLSGTGPLAYRWSLNSLYDPNFSGIGHQPYGFDQLSVLYNRYRVIACSYVISGAPINNTYQRIAALPSNEQVNALTLSEMCENPKCRFITQAPSAALKLLTGKIYLPSLVGRNKAQYMADDRYQAQTNASPSELALLNVFMQDMSDGASTIQTAFNITLEYTVEFFDVKPLAQS